jgi:hypothetical protein
MELTATPPVLVIVTGTIGIGEYGGGVVGNSAVDGAMCTLTVVATVVGGWAAVVGGLVVGGFVVGDGTVVVATLVVVATGWTVVVPDACAVGWAACCPGVDEASTRGLPWPAKAQLLTPTNPSTAQASNPATTSQRRGRSWVTVPSQAQPGPCLDDRPAREVS